MKKRLLFLGPPGAGKGTQASLVCENNSLLHLSTGDLLRSEVSAGTDLGKKAERIMNRGDLVDDELVLSIVEKKLMGVSSGWLLDGFPRNLLQAESLQTLLEKIKQPIEAVVLIEIDDQIIIQRLLSRGRDDDNEDIIRNRLEVYREKTAPLIKYYAGKGLLKSIKGAGDINEVATLVSQALV